jgi:hypothetical protein
MTVQTAWRLLSLYTHSLTHSLIHSLIYIFRYLITSWSRVLLEKLTGSQLVKKFSVFYGTRRFITAIISGRHLHVS